MQRRHLTFVSLTWVSLFGAGAMTRANALTRSDLSNTDATKALKIALEKGALSAVGLLGAQDGFLGNDSVRIALPIGLNDAANLMRRFGQGASVDELITAMNRGAEAAVPMAKDLLINAVHTMSVNDAKSILSGGNTAGTTYFATKARPALAQKFLPAVHLATGKIGLAGKYNDVAGKAAELGLLSKEDANIQQYVTNKTLDGLYFMIAEEEMKIRQNPVGYRSALLTKVFGAIR